MEETKNEEVNDRKTGYGYKLLGKIIIVLGIIGSIVLGNTFRIPTKHGYATVEEFNYYLMMGSSISSIILGALFLALGEMAVQLTTIKEILLKNKSEQ